MRKRINWLFVLLTIVAIIVTTLLATIVNYTVLKQEVIDDLRIYAQTLKKDGVRRSKKRKTVRLRSQRLFVLLW